MVGVWGRMLYMFCFLLERVSEAFRWASSRASGTAGVMYWVGIFECR